MNYSAGASFVRHVFILFGVITGNDAHVEFFNSLALAGMISVSELPADLLHSFRPETLIHKPHQ